MNRGRNPAIRCAALSYALQSPFAACDSPRHREEGIRGRGGKQTVVLPIGGLAA